MGAIGHAWRMRLLHIFAYKAHILLEVDIQFITIIYTARGTRNKISRIARGHSGAAGHVEHDARTNFHRVPARNGVPGTRDGLLSSMVPRRREVPRMHEVKSLKFRIRGYKLVPASLSRTSTPKERPSRRRSPTLRRCNSSRQPAPIAWRFPTSPSRGAADSKTFTC